MQNEQKSMTHDLRQKLLTNDAFVSVEAAIETQRRLALEKGDAEWTLVEEESRELEKKDLTPPNLAQRLRNRTRIFKGMGLGGQYTKETSFAVTFAYLAAYLEQPLRRDAEVVTDEMVVETADVLLEQAKGKKDFQLQDCQSIRDYIATVLRKPQISNLV